MTASVLGISTDGRAASVDRSAVHEYTVVYKVQTDDRSDGPSIVESAFGIPSIGDLYSVGNDNDTSAICVGKSVRQGDSPWHWEVDVTYSNEPVEIIGVPANPAQPTPLQEPADISYGFQARRILVPGTYNDPSSPPSDYGYQSGIYAPNGELFDPQPEVEINEPVLTIKRNVQFITGAGLMTLANCVNSDYWQGASPRQLKMGAPQATRKYHTAVGFYWEVNYSIAYRYDTWDIQILNQGTFYWTAGKPTSFTQANVTAYLERIRDKYGIPVTVVNLTTDGNINSTSTPSFTRIKFYRELNFGSLNLV